MCSHLTVNTPVQGTFLNEGVDLALLRNNLSTRRYLVGESGYFDFVAVRIYNVIKGRSGVWMSAY